MCECVCAHAFIRCPFTEHESAPWPGLPCSQENFTPRDQAEPLRGAWLVVCMVPAGSLRLSGTTNPSDAGAGAALPGRAREPARASRQNEGSLFQSLLSCDLPLTLSRLSFVSSFILRGREARRERGKEGRGSWLSGPRCWQPTHLLDLQPLPAQTVAQWHHPKGILMSL